MEKQEKNTSEYLTIDLFHVLKVLWKKAWLIVMSAVLAGAVGFSFAYFAIAPTYSSSVMLYVNNSSFSLGNTSFSISASQITAAQSLVKTYGEILKNRTTLERIIEKSEVKYTYEELSGKIEASPSNNTEIMKVTVTTNDPYEAANIANVIAEVLPSRISEIIDGASMEVVDYAVANLNKVGPSITKYTALGLIFGGFISVFALTVFAVLDDTIHDEEYVLRTYDYPILAKIPNLFSENKKGYGSYYQSEEKAKQ